MMPQSKIKLNKINDKKYELDVRGMVCPFPQVMVVRALETLDKDNILEVLIDNPPSIRDIPLGLERKGYKINVEKIDNINSKLIIQQ
ncbi:MAG: sulfurtransferase TusA family protein [Candidatus Odinarchaeota archaeon]